MPKGQVSKMSREELEQTVKAEHAAIREAAATMAKLAEVIGRTNDFTFSALEETKRASKVLGDIKQSIETIKRALIVRGRAKFNEECKA